MVQSGVTVIMDIPAAYVIIYFIYIPIFLDFISEVCFPFISHMACFGDTIIGMVIKHVETCLIGYELLFKFVYCPLFLLMLFHVSTGYWPA